MADLTEKLEYTRNLVDCWVDSWGVDGVYVAFSGGKDSTVLAHIVREKYPEVPLVFNNTGLELPEIVRFVRTFDNVTELRPRLPFHHVVERFGWPVVSKEQSQFIYEYKTTKSPKLRKLRWEGRGNGWSKIAEKWKFLTEAPFLVGNKCCDKLKKEPAKKYEKLTGRHPMLGVMSGEGKLRAQTRHVCNIYDSQRPVSRPLLRWTEQDVWEYLRLHSVNYCEVYDQGWDRTGCMFCMFGIHKDKPNKFQLMKKTHPHQYDYVINKLGAKQVLDFMGIPY
jgi:3'-phosphoadenosine 5'-phosphosulfate sulfotransferase (PAPS reductase)/FAD synthetase